MSKLIDFMHKLGADASFATAYQLEPEKLMADAELSAQEQQLLLAQDVAALEVLTGLQAKANPKKTVNSYAK
ncbi:hypothetical protein DU002_02030 [Corallincola holothuriorum]|uniref:Extradiol ring-cleavage dioxygenase LigAB LigA subunit domain-containing protein n=1 Tax=Corallincola holothuriorum TaxID=2282215 RepID=A0A368NS40_9GAMM|nr:hypothetical protein [Corallincola holothuriorum]RCU52763.1 hypothetical protein DU002_02030 [Corallincola holothuriorum]